MDIEIDNEISLKPSDIATALAYAVAQKEPIMLVGPPGCGKTSFAKQCAENTNSDLIVFHPVTDDPTDAKGLPWISSKSDFAEFKPFGDLYKALTATKPTIVFIDDLGQAMPATQSSWMRPVLERKVGNREFPDCVSFLAATNRRGDKAGVSGILEPVKGRFTIINVVSDLDDFCNNLFSRGQSYGLCEDTIISGAAFLRFCPDLLNKFNPTADISNSPTERNWVAAFKHAGHNLPGHIELALIAGRVGSGPAAQYAGFLKVYRNLPALESILLDPVHAIIPNEPSALYAVAVGLASKAAPGNFDRISTYARRLDEAEYGDIASLLIRDSVRRNYQVVNTEAFIRLASTPTGKLMIGNA